MSKIALKWLGVVICSTVALGGALFYADVLHKPGNSPAELSEDQLGLPDSADSNRVEPRPAEPFSLKDSTGKPHKLTDLKGSVVLIHFWASWCPPCLPELPEIVALAHDYEGKKLKVLAISQDEQWQNALDVFPKGSEIGGAMPRNLLMVLDDHGQISDKYGSYMFPETYLINSKQQIVAKLVGPQDWSSADIRGLIDKTLSGS